jgi:hypothetical protein
MKLINFTVADAILVVVKFLESFLIYYLYCYCVWYLWGRGEVFMVLMGKHEEKKPKVNWPVRLMLLTA